jgi:hypothetical protein
VFNKTKERERIVTTEKIRVGIIGANVRCGWGRDAHIPALSALPEFEIAAVCTSRNGQAFRNSPRFCRPLQNAPASRRGPRLHLCAGAFSPSAGDGCFECKLDGYRAITVIDAAGMPQVRSRNRLSLENKFPVIIAVESEEYHCGPPPQSRRPKWWSEGSIS